MKKLIIYILFLASIEQIVAQDALDDEKQQPKNIEKINAARIALISEKLQLTPEQAEKFWPIYREFREQRQELRNKYRSAERTQDIAKPKAERDQELIQLGFELKQQIIDLEKKYSERLLKVISAQQLLALPKAEEEFRRMLLQRLQDRKDMREMRMEQRENRRNRLEQRKERND
jgi:hypothetical protein